ncbi:UrcA family protein [Oleisolibacter albus]|uniref:UrcA family protein n=1 Tax=Oleisolibacter albus TaxID=2171757 RepID=UPI000DF1CDDD|nr:UrcA family protein [Oleisolibacter albus]
MRPLFGSAVLALALLSASASAQTLPEVVTSAGRDYTNSTGFRRTVDIRDIDPSAPDARRQIVHRVRMAAWDGCREIHRDEPPAQTLASCGICVRASVAMVRPRIDRLLADASAGRLAETQVALVGQR